MATRKKKTPARVEVPHRSASEVSESDVRAATHILTMDYYNDVRGVAKDLAERMKAGEIDPDEYQDAVHEAIDGHQRIIYTQQAKEVLLVSDNADAYVDEFGTEGVVEGDSIMWGRLAFVAMQQDVYKELDVRGINVNDPDSWPDIDLKEFD